MRIISGDHSVSLVDYTIMLFILSILQNFFINVIIDIEEIT